ncbi:MAG: coiled-coil domain-containing protein [Candidatus Dormibacteria bacterium]
MEGNSKLMTPALALVASLVAAMGLLGATGLSSALANSAPSPARPAVSPLAKLNQMVHAAKAQELFLMNQVQTAGKQLAVERSEIQRARSQLASLISAEYTGAPNGLVEVFASGSLSQALDTQITLSRLTAAEKSAVSALAADMRSERRSQRQLLAEQAKAVVTEKRLQAEEIVAAFEAAHPSPPPPTAAPKHSPQSTKATTPAAAKPVVTPTPTPTPAPTPPPTPAATPVAPPPAANPAPSQGAFSVGTNLTQPSGITLAQVQQFLQGTPLEADAGYFMDAQAASHVSAIYLISDAVLETGWGTSSLYLQKHNLFGFHAYDVNPLGDGSTFPNDQTCISFVSWYVSVYYLTPPGYQVPNYPGQPGSVATGQFYNGPTPAGMSVDYASDPAWATKIAQIGDLLQSTPG